MIKNALFVALVTCVFSLMFIPKASARGGGGGHSIAGLLNFTSPSQDDTDTLITRANTRVGPITTKSLGQGYEFAFMYQYRISGTVFAIGFRPSYFMQSSKGEAPDGSKYNYAYTGWSFFPMLKIIPLENEYIKFFMQVGVGYGRLSGKIDEGAASIEYTGGSFGGISGLGAEFCFSDSHCMVLEGNLRYLPFERNKATKVSGTFASDSLTNAVDAQEVEIDSHDLGSTMSGVQAVLGYIFTF